MLLFFPRTIRGARKARPLPPCRRACLSGEFCSCASLLPSFHSRGPEAICPLSQSKKKAKIVRQQESKRGRPTTHWLETTQQRKPRVFFCCLALSFSSVPGLRHSSSASIQYKGSFLMLKMPGMGDPRLRTRLHMRRVHKWAGPLFPDDCETLPHHSVRQHLYVKRVSDRVHTYIRRCVVQRGFASLGALLKIIFLCLRCMPVVGDRLRLLDFRFFCFAPFFFPFFFAINTPQAQQTPSPLCFFTAEKPSNLPVLNAHHAAVPLPGSPMHSRGTPRNIRRKVLGVFSSFGRRKPSMLQPESPPTSPRSSIANEVRLFVCRCLAKKLLNFLPSVFPPVSEAARIDLMNIATARLDTFPTCL